MTEQEALDWLDARGDVPRETLASLHSLREFVATENENQNLVARSTLDQFFARHIVDSVQLLDHVNMPSNWIDLGSGAGFPGLVIAAMRPEMPVVLVESRRKRVDFLIGVASRLNLANVRVVGSRLETVPSEPFAAISARAFAPLDRLLPIAHRFSKPETIWVLPKGRGAAKELEAVKTSWQGDFRVVPSVTDPEAAIIVADHVQPKGRR
ncbi:16S rRNA (guanine(527)-N(7))-methyltransferase RsmG [Sphingomonas montanisoli]|uniref:Ribosomal RNA small subunit methyltransferase G n=1 Tax=Sphingomonas montanisoli TaxID=2606412 RepID=A0A5D9C8L7_9SPHN|nr:16S rRNA (guanine(527)-N(7))-methyltransferase RsmG [Sphingomonas montanisoli]TZG26371.1 16S rRNA (guanine(527)-N(7))-methyltransferase RsmG [Sphingomonas montanisoli]